MTGYLYTAQCIKCKEPIVVSDLLPMDYRGDVHIHLTKCPLCGAQTDKTICDECLRHCDCGGERERIFE